MAQHIYIHDGEEQNKGFWFFVEFVIPVIVYTAILYFILSYFGVDSGVSFYVGFIISILPAILTMRKLDKLFNKVAKFMHGK